jgi:hypothetical protein
LHRIVISARVESVAAFANGNMTVGDSASVYFRKVRASASLKPRSKDYREMMVDFIARSWPGPMETDVRKVSERGLRELAHPISAAIRADRGEQ